MKNLNDMKRIRSAINEKVTDDIQNNDDDDKYPLLFSFFAFFLQYDVNSTSNYMHASILLNSLLTLT